MRPANSSEAKNSTVRRRSATEDAADVLGGSRAESSASDAARMMNPSAACFMETYWLTACRNGA